MSPPRDRDFGHAAAARQLPVSRQCRTPGCTQRLWHLGPCGHNHPAPPAGLPSGNLRARPNAGVQQPAQAQVRDPEQENQEQQEQAQRAIHPTIVGEQPLKIEVADLEDGVECNQATIQNAIHFSAPLDPDKESLPIPDNAREMHSSPQEQTAHKTKVTGPKEKLIRDNAGGPLRPVAIPKNAQEAFRSPERERWHSRCCCVHSREGFTWGWLVCASFVRFRAVTEGGVCAGPSGLDR